MILSILPMYSFPFHPYDEFLLLYPLNQDCLINNLENETNSYFEYYRKLKN